MILLFQNLLPVSIAVTSVCLIVLVSLPEILQLIHIGFQFGEVASCIGNYCNNLLVTFVSVHVSGNKVSSSNVFGNKFWLLIFEFFMSFKFFGF